MIGLCRRDGALLKYALRVSKSNVAAGRYCQLSRTDGRLAP